MSSGHTTRDGMFAVRKAAWWDLDGSHVLPDYPTREEAQKTAHPWEPVAEPVFRRVPKIEFDGTGQEALTEVYEPIEGQHLNARSDDGFPLGVVSDSLETVTNGTMYDIAEAIEGEAKGSVKYETAGSLYGGKKVWLLICLKEPLMIPGHQNGSVIPYFAMQNDHSGGGSFRGQATMVTIVCDNTSKMADLDAQARGTEFVFRHTKNVAERIEEAKEALAGWRNSIEEYQRLAEHLIYVRIIPEQLDLYLQRFIPMPPPHVSSERVESNVVAARNMIRRYLASETCEGIEYTAYGVLQASVEYLNHGRKAHSAESRFKRAYLDRSVLTQDAVRIIKEVSFA